MNNPKIEIAMSNIWLEMDKEVAHWKRLLLKYGDHLPPCKEHQMHPECSCGWDELEATLEKEVGSRVQS